MIAAIGLMVGAYIITRMTAMLTRPDSSKVVRVLCVLTIAVSLMSCLFMLTGGGAAKF
ncbi:hypothetical protein RAS12_01965 [Achromobacter seleniivolatilans]|uniref:Uncharacterized protein n=1 Tax=Achromobacter seleniivolatilans TaxID=3047478 RepID=A0ABY9M2G8_9BURK|nr:hypothetical protein [Achromobacter sp. R39]WMD21155.1 hypothetical protein RAS12_01965 [Achromobacter sp. R39]